MGGITYAYEATPAPLFVFVRARVEVVFMLMGPFLDFSIGSDFSGSGKFGYSWRSRAVSFELFQEFKFGLVSL